MSPDARVAGAVVVTGVGGGGVAGLAEGGALEGIETSGGFVQLRATSITAAATQRTGSTTQVCNTLSRCLAGTPQGGVHGPTQQVEPALAHARRARTRTRLRIAGSWFQLPARQGFRSATRAPTALDPRAAT